MNGCSIRRASTSNSCSRMASGAVTRWPTRRTTMPSCSCTSATCPGAVHRPRVRQDEGARHPALRGAARQLLPARGQRQADRVLASGTGFAPIKAIIEHALYRDIRRPMTLWGGRRPGRHLHDGPGAPLGGDGAIVPFRAGGIGRVARGRLDRRTGFVHRAVMEDLPDMSGLQVYACGAPVVVDSARADFTAVCHLPEDEFHADSLSARPTSRRRRHERGRHAGRGRTCRGQPGDRHRHRRGSRGHHCRSRDAAGGCAGEHPRHLAVDHAGVLR